MTNETQPVEPTAPRAKSNCAVAVGITCLVVLILGVLILLWIVRMLSTNPAFKQAYGGAKLMAECQLHLQNPNSKQDINDALERYRTRNGKYPAKLDELYPDFLEDKAVLHCPADPRPTDVVSYGYTQPAVDAPGTTVVVECRRHVIVHGQPPWVLMLRKDGQVTRSGYAPHGGPAEPKQPGE